MNPNKAIFYAVLAIIGVAILWYISWSVISAKAVPSLGDYLASSTMPVASSTPSVAYSPSATAPTTTPMATLLRSMSSGAAQKEYPPLAYASTTILGPKGNIYAEIADTPALQERGLSGRSSLAPRAGMLFIFPTPGVYSFWMKDMSFSIDMIWIGADKKVVKIDEGASPSSYPNTFRPTTDVQYVLEVNSGFTRRLGIVPGTKLVF